MGHRNIARLLTQSGADIMLDPGASGTITVRQTMKVSAIVTAAAETRTLSAPDFVGMFHTMYLRTDGGTCTITVTNGYDQAGNTTLTFSDVGDYALLTSINDNGTLRWQVVQYVSGSEAVASETIQLDDNDAVQFGTGSDVEMNWNGTQLELAPPTGMWANCPLVNYANGHTLAYEFFDDFMEFSVGDATSRWTLDATNGTAVLGSAETASTPGLGGYITMNAPGTDNDFANLKLTSTNTGAPFRLADSGKAMWYECRFMVSSVTDVIYYIGLFNEAETEVGADNTGAENITDGIYWRTLSATPTEIDFAHNLNGTEAEVQGNSATLAAATAVTVGFYFDGTTLTPYVNGTAKTTVLAAATNFPVDQGLTPGFFVKDGAGASKSLYVDWVKCVQIR
jgi:hypothetical protein